MVTSTSKATMLHRLTGSFVTPSSTDDTDEPKRKRARLSSPMSPHAIARLRVPVIAETVSVDEIAEEEAQNDPRTDHNEVELINPFLKSAVIPNDKKNDDFNLLIPQLELFQLIKENCNCKKCNSSIL
jgi:hypothetical protein